MNILIIHNDNLPEALAQDISSTEGIHADLKIFKNNALNTGIYLWNNG